jgi:hypothetical protein
MNKLSDITLLLEIKNEDGTFERQMRRFDTDIDDLPDGPRQLEQGRRIDEVLEVFGALMRKAVGLSNT